MTWVAMLLLAAAGVTLYVKDARGDWGSIAWGLAWISVVAGIVAVVALHLGVLP